MGLLVLEPAQSTIDQFAETQIEFAFQQHAQNPQGLTSQCERIFVAGWQLPDGKQTTKGFKLVCKCKHDPDGGFCERIARKSG